MSRAAQPASARNPQGSGVGAAICAGFAALWAVTGTRGWPAPFAEVIYAIAFLVTALLLAGCVQLVSRARHLPRRSDPAAARRRTGWFLLVVLLEIVAINVIVLTLAMHHLDAYQMPAIALVVGLHFFPLARVFAMPHYVLTGAVMTAASIGGIALLVIGSDARLCNTGVDFACAAILWTTAGLTLRLWRQRSDGRPSRR